MKKFIINYIEDLCILFGLVVIIMATFFISVIGGMYVTGTISVLLGAYFTRYPPKGR